MYISQKKNVIPGPGPLASTTPRESRREPGRCSISGDPTLLELRRSHLVPGIVTPSKEKEKGIFGTRVYRRLIARILIANTNPRAQQLVHIGAAVTWQLPHRHLPVSPCHRQRRSVSPIRQAIASTLH